MVIHFEKTLQQALLDIGFYEYRSFSVHEKEEIRTYLNSDDLVSKYGDSKWAVIDFLNERYNGSFDLHNWIDKNTDDEVAYFLNEAGSNSLVHSQFKMPSKFHLWLGAKGFIIGVEQRGEGFNAKTVEFGGAFSFFSKCNSKVFFDDHREARIVFIEHSFLKTV